MYVVEAHYFRTHDRKNHTDRFVYVAKKPYDFLITNAQAKIAQKYLDEHPFVTMITTSPSEKEKPIKVPALIMSMHKANDQEAKLHKKLSKGFEENTYTHVEPAIILYIHMVFPDCPLSQETLDRAKQAYEKWQQKQIAKYGEYQPQTKKKKTVKKPTKSKHNTKKPVTKTKIYSPLTKNTRSKNHHILKLKPGSIIIRKK